MDYKKIFKYFIFLVALGVLSGGILATVNSFTAPIIEAAEEAALQAELKSIFGEDSQFPSVEKPARTARSINEIYQWQDSSSTLQGIVYKVTTQGYGGHVVILIAFSIENNQVIGFSVLSVSGETPGYGQKATDHDFNVSNQTAGSISITPISGATVTSNAIRNAISIASANYLTNKQLLIGGNNE